MTGLAEAGELDAVFLDLDNVLVQPRGFIGSERQEWRCTDVVARQLQERGHPVGSLLDDARARVLKRREIDEERMVGNRFYEIPGHATPRLARMCDALRRDGIAVVGLSARPARIEGRTLRMLASVGVVKASGSDGVSATSPRVGLDDILLTGGTGASKVTAMRSYLRSRLGNDIRLNRVVMVDDLEANIAPMRNAGARTVLFSDSRANYNAWPSSSFVHQARRESTSNRDAAFELALNAVVVAATDGEAEAIAAEASSYLGPRAEGLLETAAPLRAVMRRG